MRILRSWTFTWWEVGLLKLCLITFGLALAVHFFELVAPLLTLWWALFAVTALYFIARYFREEIVPKREGAQETVVQ